jgi:hypothetical protein
MEKVGFIRGFRGSREGSFLEGPFLTLFGANFGYFWGQNWVFFGYFWGQNWVFFGYFWGQNWVFFGYFWGQNWVFFDRVKKCDVLGFRRIFGFIEVLKWYK